LKATSTGNVTIDVYFKQGVDADMATVNVQNRVSKAESQLPSAVTSVGIETSKMQNSFLRIVGVRSADGKYSDDFVSNYVDINIKPRVQRIFGVGSVSSLGNTYALRVWMKPDVMAQFLAEVRAPEGYTLEQTDQLLKQVEEKVKDIPEIESYALVSGYGMNSGYGSSYGFLVVRLKNWDEREGAAHNVDAVIFVWPMPTWRKLSITFRPPVLPFSPVSR